MKKTFIFIGGVATGVVLTIIILMLIANINSSRNGITIFEKEGDCISENSFEVFQVLDTGDALANELEQDVSISIPTGLTVLFLCEDGQSYYDDQIINIPSDKCAKQIGVFRYTANSGFEKTVPIVSIRDK